MPSAAEPAGGRWLRACGLAAVLLAGHAAAPAVAATLSEAELAAICAEAEGRYRDVFGRAPGEEPFTVVLMYRSTFCPLHVTVKQGDLLRWINVDRRTSHSVWFKEVGREESDRIFPEEAIDMTVDLPPGDYPYLCGPHWERENMIGRMTVIER